MDINSLISVLDPKMQELKNQLSAEVANIDKKTAEIVSDLNEKSAKSNETLGQLKDRVEQVIASQGKLKAGVENEAMKGMTNSDILAMQIKQIVHDNYDTMKNSGKASPFYAEAKDVGNMTMIANLTGTSQVSYVNNPIMRSYFEPHLYNVFSIIPTSTGNVTFPRGNSPVGEGSFGAQTEGIAKTQVDYDVTMVNTSVPFIAGYARVSRQMLQDLPFLAAYLQRSMVEDLNRAINTRFLNTIATNSTALSTSETINIAKMVAGLAQHGNLGLGMANLILTTWASWGKALLTKPGDYSVPASVAVDASGSVRINGVPLVPHSQVTTDRFYILNTDAFAIAQASGLAVRSTEFNEDDFIKNLVTYRAEVRAELLSFQPTAAVYGSTGT
jgi:hypothetical protein